MYVPLGSTAEFTDSIRRYYILRNCGHARSQSGRRPVEANPPLYYIYTRYTTNCLSCPLPVSPSVATIFLLGQRSWTRKRNLWFGWKTLRRDTSTHIDASRGVLVIFVIFFILLLYFFAPSLLSSRCGERRLRHSSDRVRCLACCMVPGLCVGWISRPQYSVVTSWAAWRNKPAN